jgi:hypothetical protein
VLADGVTAPVAGLMDKPAGVAEYVPPAVPVRVTGCAVATEVQKGDPAYEIVAAGKLVTTKLAVLPKVGDVVQLPSVKELMVTVVEPAFRRTEVRNDPVLPPETTIVALVAACGLVPVKV